MFASGANNMTVSISSTLFINSASGGSGGALSVAGAASAVFLNRTVITNATSSVRDESMERARFCADWIGPVAAFFCWASTPLVAPKSHSGLLIPRRTPVVPCSPRAA